jgi:hypothetical protein
MQVNLASVFGTMQQSQMLFGSSAPDGGFVLAPAGVSEVAGG